MDTVTLLQGDPYSNLTPLILVHAISGLALPYFALGPLSELDEDRPVYGISSPMYTSNLANPLQYSLSYLASQYVNIVRREIQPQGPYLLGGWSMGGMIAMEMAAVFQMQGDEVEHVIMIDSVNPKYFPKFADKRQQDIQSTMTYNAIAKRMNAPEIPLFQCGLFEDDYYSSSSDESGPDTEMDSEQEDEDYEDLSVPEMLERMRKHIHLGLGLLAEGRSRVNEVMLKETDVTLIRCTVQEDLPSVLGEGRKTLAQRKPDCDSLCWPADAFRNFNTLTINATHDGCFDNDHADELTDLVRGVMDVLPL